MVRYTYDQWETFIDGMYKTKEDILNYQILFESASVLLKNNDLFLNQGLLMIEAYQKACDTFLTNKSINKIAFIGQATACFYKKIPEIVTKDCFKSLSLYDQYKADDTAKKILAKYNERHSKIHF